MKVSIRLFATLIVAWPALTARGQDCCNECCVPAQRVVSKLVTEQIPYTAYKVQYETIMEEREITETKPILETETRTRRYKVAKPVTEEYVREEKYYVMKPVRETECREEEYQQTTYETETQIQQQRIVSQRPVVETQYRQQQYSVRRAINETVMQDQSYTAYEPTTTYRTQLVDQGGVVDSYGYVPGRTRNHLGWVPRGYATDNLSQQTFYHRGGLHWVPTTAPGQVVVNRQYVPNYVAAQIPQTTMTAKVITQQVPVNVTRYVDDVVTEQVPFQVQRMEQVEEVREIPITVQKPVTQTMVRKIPIERIRYEKEEHIRRVPVTMQKIEYEEREEDYPVQVRKMVTETRKIQVPITQRKLVPYTAYRTVQRVVTMRMPIGEYDDVVIEGAAADYVQPERKTTDKIVQPPHESRLVPKDDEPARTPAIRKVQPTPAKKPAPAPVEDGETDAADVKPALKPILDKDELKLNTPEKGKQGAKGKTGGGKMA